MIRIKHKQQETHTDEQSKVENDVESLDNQIKHEEKESKEISELTNTLKRVQAEFENFKKRTDKENIQVIKNANATLITDILPVLDSFELALKNNGTENIEVAKYRKGLELIYTQLLSILQNKGLRKIDATHKKFDPYKHEVLMIKEHEGEEDIILQDLQTGYMLNDIVIRHSKVIISKKSENKQ